MINDDDDTFRSMLLLRLLRRLLLLLLVLLLLPVQSLCWTFGCGDTNDRLVTSGTLAVRSC